jgi:hypothetical protein
MLWNFVRGVTTPVDVILLKMQILIKFSYRHLHLSKLRTHAHHFAQRGLNILERK